jgi:hypothetical protein
MDYENLTDEQLEEMFKNIRLQQDALDTLEDNLIHERSRRAGKKASEAFSKLFNF